MSAIDAQFKGQLGQFTLDVAFTAPARGVTALFGPSGCGKTSVLRAMAGLRRLPGRLSVNGEVWQDDAVFRKPHQRPIGYVFQEASLFDHLSVERNLTYGARRAKGGADDGGPNLDDVADLLGLTHLLGRAPTALSGGERQRVALGRALLSSPRLLLMDEPLSALDRGTKEEILPYLDSLQERLEIPVIYVSHDIGEVVRLAERMVVLNRGRVAAEGPVGDLLTRLDLGPIVGRFEAGAVLTARVVRHDLAFQLTETVHGGQPIFLPMTDAPIDSLIRVRIRARDVALAIEPPKGVSFQNILKGVVSEIMAEPDTPYAETLVDLGVEKIRARLTRAAAADLALAPGRPVYVLLKSATFDRRNRTTLPIVETDG